MAVRIRLPGGEMVTAAALQIAAIGFMIQFCNVRMVDSYGFAAIIVRYVYMGA